MKNINDYKNTCTFLSEYIYGEELEVVKALINQDKYALEESEEFNKMINENYGWNELYEEIETEYMDCELDYLYYNFPNIYECFTDVVFNGVEEAKEKLTPIDFDNVKIALDALDKVTTKALMIECLGKHEEEVMRELNYIGIDIKKNGLVLTEENWETELNKYENLRYCLNENETGGLLFYKGDCFFNKDEYYLEFRAGMVSIYWFNKDDLYLER